VASRSPPRIHRGNAGVRGPSYLSARARAVGPSEGLAPEVPAVHFRLLWSGNLTANRVREAEEFKCADVDGDSRQTNPFKFRAQSAIAGRPSPNFSEAPRGHDGRQFAKAAKS
jgi:hypothetical protein